MKKDVEDSYVCRCFLRVQEACESLGIKLDVGGDLISISKPETNRKLLEDGHEWAFFINCDTIGEVEKFLEGWCNAQGHELSEYRKE